MIPWRAAIGPSKVAEAPRAIARRSANSIMALLAGDTSDAALAWTGWPLFCWTAPVTWPSLDVHASTSINISPSPNKIKIPFLVPACRSMVSSCICLTGDIPLIIPGRFPPVWDLFMAYSIYDGPPAKKIPGG
jgi:hypothetical protein